MEGPTAVQRARPSRLDSVGSDATSVDMPSATSGYEEDASVSLSDVPVAKRRRFDDAAGERRMSEEGFSSASFSPVEADTDPDRLGDGEMHPETEEEHVSTAAGSDKDDSVEVLITKKTPSRARAPGAGAFGGAAGQARKSSLYRGICWDRQIRKWRAETWYNGRKRFLGNFVNEQTAAQAYDEAARKWHGATAKLNFPKAGEVGTSDTSSQYRGVCWDARRSKWEAKIWHGGKKHHCGYHSDEEAAAHAYDDAARRLKGLDAAIVNFAEKGGQVGKKGARAQTGGASPRVQASPRTKGRVAAKSSPRVSKAAASAGSAPSPRRRATTTRKSTPGTPRAGKSSRFRGVTWSRARRKWLAQIRIAGKLHHIGHFSDEEHAAQAFDEAALRMRGPSATLNFPQAGLAASAPTPTKSPRPRAKQQSKKAPPQQPQPEPLVGVAGYVGRSAREQYRAEPITNLDQMRPKPPPFMLPPHLQPDNDYAVAAALMALSTP